MRKKSKKNAIALISLVLVIVILLMIAGLVTYSGYDIINQSKETAFINDIIKIEEAVQEYYLVNGSIPTLEGGTKINAEQYKFRISSLRGEKISSILRGEIIKNGDNGAMFYEIDISKIGIDEIQNGLKKEATDYYMVSDESFKVYYYPGYKVVNNLYFSSISLVDKN